MDNKIYQSSTGVLISQNDYNCLADSQKDECKEFKIDFNPAFDNKFHMKEDEIEKQLKIIMEKNDLKKEYKGLSHGNDPSIEGHNLLISLKCKPTELLY